MDQVFVFDVDGVLTHPRHKQVEQLLIFDALATLLKRHQPVVLNTGRSISWLDGPVIQPLSVLIDDPLLWHFFLMIGEKGGTWSTGRDIIQTNGQTKLLVETDPTLTVPRDLQHDIRDLVAQEFASTMFIDESKLTMLTVEMALNCELSIFHIEQERLVSLIRQLLAQHEITDLYNVDPTRIATDIEHKKVGKDFGIKRMLQLFNDHQIDSTQYQYTCFGDSASDIEMANELDRQGREVSFVCVGGEELLKQLQSQEQAFEIVPTKGLCDIGTAEYLQEHVLGKVE